MAPAPGDREAVFDADGTIAVRSELGIRSYDRTGAARPESDGPADFLTTGPDGELLVGRVTPTAIVLGPIGSTAARFTFALPASPGCGKVSALSWHGDYWLARSTATACVWRAADAAFMIALPIIGGQAVLRGDRVVSVGEVTSHSSIVVTRDFAGQETNRVELTEVGASVYGALAPGGDRLLAWDPPVLWDLDSGKALAWGADPGQTPEHATFSASGDLVLLGGGVFRTSDGALVRPIDPSSRTALFAYSALALSPDGGGAVLAEMGRATLEAPSSPGVLAVLGGLPPYQNVEIPSVVNRLALSADGSILVANALSSHAVALRLAPDFADSRVVSTLFTSVNADVDVSADGAIAAIAGDGRALFGAKDGRIIWLPTAPPLDAACPIEKLRLSPQKTWAAGANHDQAIDVFAVGDMAAGDPPPPLLRLPAGCGDTAVFSRDERLMATSMPAVYRTDATSTGWQRVWSGPQPEKPGYYSLWGEGFSNDVRFSPDESQLLVSRCSDVVTCSTTLLEVATGALVRALPDVTAPHPSFSPDGSWIVAGGTLVHLPTGDTSVLGPVGPNAPISSAGAQIMTALFEPDGNIIAGASDGSLTRYCRSP